MIHINEQNSLVIKSWCNAPESGALDQAKHLAKLPFAYKQICLMPDTHEGYGMPIGGVLATEGTIIPNAVGVDIGCGMCAVKTNLKVEGLETKRIMQLIRNIIPVGFEHHPDRQDEALMPPLKKQHDHMIVVNRQYIAALKQIGTLGGGNHFIELQKDKDNNVWIMIHSGSRNFGKQVADFYNKMAADLNERYRSVIPRNWDLAFLPIGSKEAGQYIDEMKYCVEFAYANRKLMMDRILQIFKDLYNIQHEPMINIAHNYARVENHFRKNVWVHRKGATSAKSGEIGIIPGSQGSKSYIVKGKGCEDSFTSCSHGAGRKLGRREAIRTLHLQDEVDKLNALGIIHSIRVDKDLDEAPGAYKDIQTVMGEQSDLVEIVEELHPLAVIKG